MKPELNVHESKDVQAVEGLHWAPPEAPMEMPRQVLERAPVRWHLPMGLLRLMAPLQRG